MDISAILVVLTAARDVTPTTKRSAAILAKALAEDALHPLSNWVEDLSAALTEAEQAADDLAGADSDDRVDFHATLVDSVQTILDALGEVANAPDGQAAEVSAARPPVDFS